MNVLQRGMSLVLVTLMTLSPLTALAQGDAAAETSSGAGLAPQTIVTAPDVTQPTTVEEPTTSAEDTAPVSPDTEALPQLTPEETTPSTSEDADLETQLVSQDGLFRYKQYGEEGDWRVIITQYLGDGPDIVVPATLDNKMVVEVDKFFSYGGYDTIKSITLSEGITKLGSYSSFSFSEYSSLEILKLPSTLETTQLTLNGSKLTTFQAPTVSNLYLSIGNGSSDLSYLKNLTSLSDLTLSFNGADNISNLSSLNSLSAFTSLSVSYSNSLTDLTPLKGLTNLTYLSLSNLENVSDLSPLKSLVNLQTLALSSMNSLSDISPLKNLSNLSSLSLSNVNNLTDVSPLGSLTQLTSLTLENNTGLITLDGLDKALALTSLSCSGCTNLSNIDALKGLNNLETIKLSGTAITKEEAASLIQTPSDVTLNPTRSRYIDYKPSIYLEDYNTLKPDLVAEDSSIIVIDGNKLTGNQAGTTTVQLQVNGKNIGKHFSATYSDTLPDPNQPVGESVSSLPTLSRGPDFGEMYAQYSDNSLWLLTNNQSEKIMTNVKTIGVGATVYLKNNRKYSWQWVTDTNNTLWSCEALIGPKGRLSTVANQRVDDAVDSVLLGNEQKETITAYVLDTSQQVWQLNGNSGLTSPKTKKIDNTVKQLAKGESWIGYLKNNGDFYVYFDSDYYVKDGPTKIASGVTEIINSRYYRGSDGKINSVDGRFVNTDEFSDDDEWQIISSVEDDSVEKSYVKEIKAGTNAYYIMSDNTTAVRNYADGAYQYTTVLDFPITAAKPGRDNDASTESQNDSMESYALIADYDLVTDGKGGLWEISTSTYAYTHISDIFNSFVGNSNSRALGYILNNGDYYDIYHNLKDTHIKQIYSSYTLKDDGIIYFNDTPLLNNVGSISNGYFVRTDGTIWTVPTSGKPYQIYDYYGSALLIGDTNGDGLINASDALQDLRHSVKEIELTGNDFTRGNVNKDETINASDALQILRYSVKEITEF